MPIQLTTSQPTPFLSEVLAADVISEGMLAYFRARLTNRLHELILSAFQTAAERDNMTRAQLAHRINRNPTQISRWFASATNLEIATVSDLLIGMGFEPDLALSDLKPAARVTELPSVSYEPPLPANDPVAPEADKSAGHHQHGPMEQTASMLR
jgi:hypothetical protein